MKTIDVIDVIGTRLSTFQDEPNRIDRHSFGSSARAASPVSTMSREQLTVNFVPPVAVAATPKSAGAAVATEAAVPEPMAPNLPTDGLFASQFYLRNTAAGELDLGLFRGNISVWDEYTGAGVHIGIIDDGIDYNHSDLNDNYDFSRETVDGYHQASTDAHGTAVAGIIASERNGSGTVGIAYGASITMMGAISDAPNISITDSFLNAVNFDVVNNSWGYTSPWYDQFFNSGLTDEYSALYDLSLHGRGGLGTVFVKSAGNGREAYSNVEGSYVDNSNFSYTNSHWGTIAVAAVNRDGTVTAYSTEGASVLVSAFGTPYAGQIVTTDRRGADGYDSGDYTSGFNGTSAAGPMVAAIAALMIDANPYLGYRDVQEILALTARHVGTAIGSGMSGNENYAWRWNGSDAWNGGGQHFSEDYGYGLVDALAAVRLAESWTDRSTRANLTTLLPTSTSFAGAVTIPDPGTISVTFQLAAGITVEHVAIDLGLSHVWTADLDITLTSPDGTVSILLQDNGGSFNIFENGTYDITLSSNMFRGEDSGGTWTLTITDDEAVFAGELSAVGFYIKGSNSANDTYTLTEEYSNYQTPARRLIGDTDGGTDTLNAAAVFTNSIINLGGGTSTVDGVNFTVTGGIENAVGGDGADRLTGNSSSNKLLGWRGNDTLSGSSGNDTLKGGAGKDSLDGGTGTDTADYSDKTKQVIVTLNGATAVNVTVNGVAEDSIKNVERLIGGSASDKLTGDGLANLLTGNNGNDTMGGGSGIDTLTGGAGKDSLTGGSGADRFVFNAKLSATTNVDTIKDFVHNSDIIALDNAVMVGLGLTTGALSSAKFYAHAGATHGHDTSDRIVYDSTSGKLYYDSNGSASGGVTLIAVLTTHPTLDAGDFLIV
ncbi:MAG: S8 family serine peptidase [Devosia nanyangense]|uniref:S8 family serine peptidase n=1 Tax=Devosia nanyangense TaxID=1228055 RepID=A0A933NZC4_9HYPH|nr:S8 family serine peptidase [Devosia nanyangense]